MVLLCPRETPKLKSLVFANVGVLNPELWHIYKADVPNSYTTIEHYFYVGTTTLRDSLDDWSDFFKGIICLLSLETKKLYIKAGIDMG